METESNQLENARNKVFERTGVTPDVLEGEMHRRAKNIENLQNNKLVLAEQHQPIAAVAGRQYGSAGLKLLAAVVAAPVSLKISGRFAIGAVRDAGNARVNSHKANVISNEITWTGRQIDHNGQVIAQDTQVLQEYQAAKQAFEAVQQGQPPVPASPKPQSPRMGA